jgi:hypothetical protein
MQAAAATASRHGCGGQDLSLYSTLVKHCGVGERSFWLWFDRLFEMSDLEGIKGWALKIDTPSAIRSNNSILIADSKHARAFAATHPRRESCCHIVPIEKILTATNAARRVHTRIATYLGGCERSSFHDSTKFNAFTGFGFLWFYR